jgi:hypothetical protein
MEQLRNPGCVPIAASHLYKTANHTPYHLPEKMACAHPKTDEVPVAAYFGMRNLNKRGSCVRFPVAECSEIMPTAQHSGRFLHCVRIQAILDPPDKRLGKGSSPRRNLIQIEALHRVMPRMEACLGLAQVFDAVIRRQAIIDLIPEICGAHGLSRPKVRNLVQRMHTGVRTSGAMISTVPSQAFGGGPDFALNRPRISLFLPAAIRVP